MPPWFRPLFAFALLIAVTIGVGVSARARTPSAASPVPPPAPAAGATPPNRPLHEVHWQGIEVIPLTPKLQRELSAVAGGAPIPPGVVIDQVSFPADSQGFAGGDVVTTVAGVPTPDLPSFVAATDLVRDQPGAQVELRRNGQPITAVVSAARLGTANGETPPAIPPDAVPPHGCAQAHAALLHMDMLGPCQGCHLIRQGVQPPTDLGQVLPEPRPPGPEPVDPACLPNL